MRDMCQDVAARKEKVSLEADQTGSLWRADFQGAKG